MRNFLRYCLAFLGILLGLIAVFGLFFPTTLEAAVHNLLVALLNAIEPVFHRFFVLGIMLVGAVIVWRVIFPKKKAR